MNEETKKYVNTPLLGAYLRVGALLYYFTITTTKLLRWIIM